MSKKIKYIINFAMSLFILPFFYIEKKIIGKKFGYVAQEMAIMKIT
ncbi:hypothetical protein [Escherichia coli]